MRSERAGSVAGIVLAAGASTRMGRNKLLLELDGVSLLRHTVGRAAAAGLSPVLVVLGHQAERALEELSGLDCRPVLNPEYARGATSSVRAGFAALPSEAVAAVVLLADMPFVTAGMIATMVERYREAAAPLVFSDYGGVSAPPTLFDRSLFDEVRAIDDRGCLKRTVKQHRSEALQVVWPATALADLDEPADYERIQAQLGAG
jgi:molybdenum cofactor cytidylyltransferase